MNGAGNGEFRLRASDTASTLSFRQMIRPEDLFTVLGTLVAAVLLVAVVRWRKGNYSSNTTELAEENVCEHLKPALDHVRANGCRITRVGQNAPQLPLEIHVAPAFDPAAVLAELKLEPPVYLSERNVLYCKEDWCELHPKP